MTSCEPPTPPCTDAEGCCGVAAGMSDPGAEVVFGFLLLLVDGLIDAPPVIVT